MKNSLTLLKETIKRSPLRSLTNILIGSGPKAPSPDFENTAPEPEEATSLPSSSEDGGHTAPFSSFRHLSSVSEVLVPESQSKMSTKDMVTQAFESKGKMSTKDLVAQAFDKNGAGDDVVKNPKPYVEFKTGIVGTTSFLLTGNIKRLHNPYMHKFKDPLRQRLHHSMMQLELTSPNAIEMRDLIVQNNSIQDLNDCGLAAKTVDQFIKHVLELDNALDSEVHAISRKCHEFLAQAFWQGGQKSGYFLHQLGKLHDFGKEVILNGCVDDTRPSF
jgi:hypothetical protein